jgi:phage terminase large subunit-like protein
MIEMRQGAKTFNEPAKDLLTKIMIGKIQHGGNPVARWNADNLVMRADANGNIAPDKLKATDKIDGMVSLMMAWGRVMFKEEPNIFVYHEGSISKIDSVESEPEIIQEKEIKKAERNGIPCKRCGGATEGLDFCPNCGKKVNIE